MCVYLIVVGAEQLAGPASGARGGAALGLSWRPWRLGGSTYGMVTVVFLPNAPPAVWPTVTDIQAAVALVR